MSENYGPVPLYLSNVKHTRHRMTLTQQVNAVLSTLTQDVKDNKLELPSPPDLLVKIRTLVSNKETTSDDIAELVQHDPNISGRLVKVANCALFGSRHHVDSIKAAVARLGFEKVQNLIIGLSIAQSFMKSKTPYLDEYFSQCWQQSNHVAAISYVLAQHKSSIDPEKALLAGMVHNIGALPLLLRLSHIPELSTYPNVFEAVANVVIPKLYANAGRLVMESWNFPPEIVNVALSHSDLNRVDDKSMTLDDIVTIAYRISTLADQTDIKSASITMTETPVFKKFWPNIEIAEQDLKSYQDEITQMKHHITQ